MSCARLLAAVLVILATPAFGALSGERLYTQHCGACHGSHGEGGVGVPLALPDFLAVVDDEFLFKTIRHGRPGRVMPAFKNLSSAQVKAIVAHIRGFAPQVKAPVFDRIGKVHGDAKRGEALYALHCAACHGKSGEGGHGTGVTFSRPRDFPIMPPALNNPGFLAAASDQMIRATLIKGRQGTPMVSFLKQGLSEREIDDVVAYVRSFAHRPQPPSMPDEAMILEAESSYSLEETVENVKRAALGKNFRIIREQRLENGLYPEGEEDGRQVIVYFCNFRFIDQALRLDPRVGLFMPCRVTVVQQGDKVKVMSINPKHLSRLFNNAELDAACEEMQKVYLGILEEATL